MPVKTTLTFSQDDRAYMDSVVKQGHYVSISDYVRSLVRMDRAESQRLTEFEKTPEYVAALREKLIRSEQSGYVDKSPEEILQDFKDEARARGKL
jgi:putative addiction module CopG family antidote